VKLGSCLGFNCCWFLEKPNSPPLLGIMILLEGQAARSSNSVESRRPSPHASSAPLSAPLGRSPPSPLSSFRLKRCGPRSLRYTVVTVTPWIWGYKISFLISTKFRCYTLSSSLSFLFFLKRENYFVLYYRKPSGMSPRGTLVVSFMPLHGVSKCKMCLKHVNICYRSAR
jgi:hypothetical protein